MKRWRARSWRATLLVVVLGLSFAVGACRLAEPSAEDQELIFVLEGDIERLDPAVIRNPQTFRVAWQLYEGLLGLSADGQIEPRLAETWETEDFQTWRFVLRKATFHDSDLFGPSKTGREVEAEDVVFSYTSYCAPGAYASFILADSLEGCAEFGAGKAESVAGLRIIDNRTVEVRLREPEPFFLHRISSPWAAIVPRESGKPSFEDEWGLDIVTGTGPYRLTSRTESEVILDQNPDYWASSGAEVPRVVFRVVKNAAARVAHLKRGDVDVLPVPADLYDALLEDHKLRPEFADSYVLQPYSTFNHHLIGFNTELVPDPNLRSAMDLSTDRQAILDAVRAGFGQPLGGPVPPQMAGYAPLVSVPGIVDLERARQLLANSEYDGQSLELIIHDLAGSERVGEIFQQQMRDLGVEVTLTKLDYGSMIGRVINGEAPMFSMFAEIVFSSPEPLLLNLFASQKIPVPNFWRFSSPEVDRQLAELRSIANRAERLASSAQIERQISNEVPAIFLYSETPTLLRSKRFQTLPVSPNQHFRLEAVRFSE